jgi:hypothetical protein
MIFMGNGMARWPGAQIVHGNDRVGNTLLSGLSIAGGPIRR